MPASQRISLNTINAIHLVQVQDILYANATIVPLHST